MELRQLEYLVALAEERQFTRAADVTGVSQSGLSAAIRSLEDELGTRLFERTTRKVEPTEAGSALLPFARSMLGQAAAARDAVVRLSHELSGRRIGHEPLVVVLPPGHPLGARASVEHGDLARESFIDFHASWGVRRLNDLAFESRRVHRRVRFAVNDVHTLLDLVARGLGVAVVPRHVAAKPQAAELTVLPLGGDVGPGWVVSVVTAPTADSLAPRLMELLGDAPAYREPEAEAVTTD
jgi:DNA-binding transcriptional LysR family regulator